MMMKYLIHWTTEDDCCGEAVGGAKEPALLMSLRGTKCVILPF
jgi:hypothetical protein